MHEIKCSSHSNKKAAMLLNVSRVSEWFLPSLFSSNAAMTASSSIGLSEQVEYTILPPTASCSTPRTAIRSCSLANTHTVITELFNNFFFLNQQQKHSDPWLFSQLGLPHKCMDSCVVTRAHSPPLTHGDAGYCWLSTSSTRQCSSSWCHPRCRTQSREQQQSDTYLLRPEAL